MRLLVVIAALLCVAAAPASEIDTKAKAKSKVLNSANVQENMLALQLLAVKEAAPKKVNSVPARPARQVKTCHCSGECTCGCNEGFPCDCQVLTGETAVRTYPGVTVPYSTPYFTPATSSYNSRPSFRSGGGGGRGIFRRGGGGGG